MTHRATTLLVVCLALTAGCSFLAPNPDSYSSHHYYSLGVDLNGNVSDVTIRLPVAQQGGDTTYNVTTLTGNGTVEGVFDAELIDTDRGPMLELTADEVRVEPRYYRFVVEGDMGRRERIPASEYDPTNPDHQKIDRRGVGLSADQRADYPIETQAPLGASPTLYADDAVTRELADCELPAQESMVCFAYDAPVYLSYESDADVSVAGSVLLEGTNEWFEGGWSGNSYVDRIDFNVTGPQDGWVTVDGATETSRGRYPSPEA
ncbi:hypothetical protein [Haloglomus litoreum]|uniref:hypothetical protein n=1 Tax=Haloglomus litoreum TaxID=3034026 RepID=UPI0023E87C08|nr:hypothetical protein [Haloglomus sp. DT116]